MTRHPRSSVETPLLESLHKHSIIEEMQECKSTRAGSQDRPAPSPMTTEGRRILTKGKGLER